MTDLSGLEKGILFAFMAVLAFGVFAIGISMIHSTDISSQLEPSKQTTPTSISTFPTYYNNQFYGSSNQKNHSVIVTVTGTSTAAETPTVFSGSYYVTNQGPADLVSERFNQKVSDFLSDVHSVGFSDSEVLVGTTSVSDSGASYYDDYSRVYTYSKSFTIKTNNSTKFRSLAGMTQIKLETASLDESVKRTLEHELFSKSVEDSKVKLFTLFPNAKNITIVSVSDQGAFYQDPSVYYYSAPQVLDSLSSFPVEIIYSSTVVYEVS
ncbi:hypothetical protein HY990_05725 [Candidatus Micrarchaeota archaeon]|nr:hypothetical protein [Candidatus Micrarchaeota archaeon]